MSKINLNQKNAQKAQGLVEFALALPLFLLLLFGIIEFGRLLMTFSAVFSGAREAARYGAAVGTAESGIQFDHDCAGMVEAATRVGFLGGVKASQIQIKLLNSDGTMKDEDWCTEDNSYKESLLGDIIQVTVDGQFWAILPLVNLPNLPVSSTSSRIIVQNVEVYGTPQPTSVVIENPYALVLTLDINPPATGSVIKYPDKPTYFANEVVTLSPVPNTGWEFSNWSRDLSGNLSPMTITMTGNKLVTANFSQIHYNLAMNIVPAGAGTITPNPNTPTYFYGDVVKLVAEPAPGYAFIGWSGDLSGASSTAYLTIDAHKSVTAIFTELEYTLTVVTQGQGMVTIDPPGPYHYGDLVELNASADSLWNFSVWSGDLTGSLNPATIVMDRDKTINAIFEEGTYTLTQMISGGGEILRDPNLASYLPGTMVTLTAVPIPGWEFSFWTGDMSNNTQNPIQVVMDSDMVIGASFAQSVYTLSITVVGNGSVITNIDPPYAYNAVVELTARPAQGWEFSGWSDAIITSDNPASITMDGNKLVVATFTPIEYYLIVNINGQGAVTLNPSKTTYRYGDVVQLTAVPDPDYSFSQWFGDLTGNLNPVTITMNGPKSVTANFLRTCVSPSLITVTMTGGIGSSDVNFRVTNNSYSDIEILSMVVTWSTSSGRLVDIYFDNNPIPMWSGSIHKNSSPFIVTNWEPGIDRTIPLQSSKTIRVHFNSSVNSASVLPMTFSKVCTAQ